MSPNYDFLCPNKHKIEAIAKSNVFVIQCPYCEKAMERQFPSPVVMTERHSDERFDPIEGKRMSYEETRDWKQRPNPHSREAVQERQSKFRRAIQRRTEGSK